MGHRPFSLLEMDLHSFFVSSPLTQRIHPHGFVNLISRAGRAIRGSHDCCIDGSTVLTTAVRKNWRKGLTGGLLLLCLVDCKEQSKSNFCPCLAVWFSSAAGNNERSRCFGVFESEIGRSEEDPTSFLASRL